MDVASLGFGVDTSGLDNAAASLQKLVPASAAAEAAAESVTTALEGTSAAATAVSNAAKGTTTQTTATAKVITAATGAINQSATANKTSATAANTAKTANDNLAHSHQGLSTQAMSAQHSIRSMVEALASGQPISQVFTQQLNHLSYAASGPGGLSQAFSDALGMFTKLISGWMVGAVAIVAVVAAFGLIANSVMTSELALDDLSKSTDVSIQALHGLQQAASFKGISTDDFTKGIETFSNNVSDAQHNMGSLNGLMLSTGKSAKDLQGYLLNVADLISQTSSGVQKRNILEAAGLPTTQAWVRFMSQGGDAINAAINNTIGFNDAAEKNLIQKARDFDDAWNKATTNVANYFKGIVIDNLDWVTKVGQIIDLAIKLHAITSTLTAGVLPTQQKGSTDPTSKQFIGPAPPIGSTNPTSSQFIGPAAPPKPADPQTQAQLLTANQQSQSRISILGDLATVEQQGYEKQLQLNAAGLQGVGVNSQMQAKIVLATTAQAEQTRVNAQAAAGIFNIQSAQKAASDTLQHWIDQGLVDKNNADQMAAAHLVLARNIQATSDAAAVAAAPLQQLKQLELDGGNLAKSLDTATTGALNNLVQPIQDMLNGVTSLSAGFQNLGVVVLQAIQQMIIKMLILTPIAKALQSVFGGLFGFSAGGIPGASGPTSLGGAPLVPNALGGVYSGPNISSFSGQIVSKPTLFKFASGAGLMGEAGDEAIMPLKRGPSGSLGVQMYGQQAGNDNSTTHVTYAPQYTLGGNVTQDDLNNVKKAQANDRAQFTANVARAIPELRKRNVRV